MPEAEPLMTVATFDSLMEAEIACTFLDAEGIRSFLIDAEMVNTNWFISTALGGIKLQVARSDFLRAERLLHEQRHKRRRQTTDDYGLPVRRDAITADPSRAPVPNEPEEFDEEESEQNVGPVGDMLSRALIIAVLGTLVCPFIGQAYSLYLVYHAQNMGIPLSQGQRWLSIGIQIYDALVMFSVVAIALLLTVAGRH